MAKRRLPTLIAHADWSKHKRKRWIALGRLEGSNFLLSAPEQVKDTSVLLSSLVESAAKPGPVIVGFDFPIGLPKPYARRARIRSFVDALSRFGTPKMPDFYEVAHKPEEICPGRPFYPYGSNGGPRHKHLVDGLEVDMDQLLRTCDRGNGLRSNACSIFWTLGARQVGKGAISGWKEVLGPALGQREPKVAIWPFHGDLDQLLRSSECIVVETYPAEACLHLHPQLKPPGRRWSKRAQADRKDQGRYLLDWARRRRVKLEKPLRDAIGDGFGAKENGEDPFDAVVGLMSMTEVLLGHRSDGAPENTAIRSVEGWIFGQKGPKD